MLTLKPYQEATLDVLREYLRDCNADGPDVAFYRRTKRQYHEVQWFAGLPYVCLRVPTGGGKSILAAHSIQIACREFLKSERAVVLWLAPTTTIVEQTLKLLRDRRSPYRQVLDAQLERVSILSIGEALSVSRTTMDTESVVIVTTLAALRREDTEGLKVYESSGTLMSHFSGIDEKTKARLEKSDAGVLVYSLANVLRMHRPLVIVDEAHNARTRLSFDSLARFSPACIVEYSATPKEEGEDRSNILHAVSASELKAAEMLKLPIRVTTRPQWGEAVAEAVGKRAELEKLAVTEEQRTGEYIRPIVLLQAQPTRQGDDNAVTVDVLRKFLIDDLNLPADQIAVAYKGTDDLEGVNVLARDCPIRFVLTVSKVKEGWDCPFAYVLATVSTTASETAVTQILGRVLRMPKARRKQDEALNLAYAYAPATAVGVQQVLATLEEAIVECGFNRFEARASVEPAQTQPGLFDQRPVAEPVVVPTAVPPPVESMPPEVAKHVTFNPATATVRYTGPAISAEVEEKIVAAAKNDEQRTAVRRVARGSRGEASNPAAMSLPLTVPVLAVRDGGQFELFDDQHLGYPWDLSACDPTLTPAEFPTTAQGQVAEVDVDQAGLVAIRTIRELQEQMKLFDTRAPQTDAELAVWIDQHIDHPDVPLRQSQPYFLKMVRGLVAGRGIELGHLIANRFRLRDAADRKVDRLRAEARRQSYNQMLFSPDAAEVDVDPMRAFQFPLNVYPVSRLYAGPHRFARHYYANVGDMNGEEAALAAVLDSSPKVKYWVRNVERQEQCSFWLPLPGGKFYPDFVARLADDRVLVAEYKGGHLDDTADSDLKRAVGELWQAKSKGRCNFLWVTKETLDSAAATLSG